ncbi:UbiA family prenyltransferase, partial [Pseudomonas viridiflava]|uniref:UbiA family prenyltransferase n=1 Tax=Pseudomonas viridiflava TaxID=33069 RepID=UPI0013DF4452
TSTRPLVTGELSDREALVFSWVLGILSTAVLGFLVNWLAAALSVIAILIYVFVYTLWLKRRTPQNIVWGGSAGCMPVLIGWAGVTGLLTWTPVILFMVIFL